MGCTIESLSAADWPAVRDIYAAGIATGLATFETDVPDWDQWDANQLSFGRLVARSAGRVVGWAALSPVSGRACYAGVAEASVYVALDSWGRGIGRALLEAIITVAEQHGIWTLQGSTFAENHASLKLQGRCGFRVVGRRERIAQFDGQWRDTVLTERRSRVVNP